MRFIINKKYIQMKVNQSKPPSTVDSSQQNIFKQEEGILSAKVELKYIQNTYLYLNKENGMHSQFPTRKYYNLTYLKQSLIEQKQLNKTDLLELIAKFKNIIKNQENLLKINGNVTVIGDIHGQFYDFIKVLSLAKLKYTDLFEKLTSGNLLFLGDYVDRGYYSIEVMTLIMALKVNNPKNVFCLRGNHQCRAMTIVYNFKAENVVKYDQEVYNTFMEAFDMLPLAAVVNNSFFCVHGGISDQFMEVQKINQINRFSQIPEEGAFCDFMWSDPAPKNRQKFYDESEFNDTRMCSIFFGKTLTNKFIETNNLKTIIRAHQVFPEGFQRRDWNSKNKNLPSVITIFSAPNYCGIYGNLGAILHIKNNTLQVRQYKQQALSKRIKTFFQVFEWSLPEVLRIINEFSKNMMKCLGTKYLQDQFPQFLQASYQQKLGFLLDYYNNHRKSISNEEINQKKELATKKQGQRQQNSQIIKQNKHKSGQNQTINIDDYFQFKQSAKQNQNL